MLRSRPCCSRQLGQRQRAVADTFYPGRAITPFDVLGCHLEQMRCQLDCPASHPPRGRGRSVARHDRPSAGVRAHAVRNPAGISADDPDPVDADTQLVAHDLGQGSQQTLADVDCTSHDSHVAVAADPYVGALERAGTRDLGVNRQADTSQSTRSAGHRLRLAQVCVVHLSQGSFERQSKVTAVKANRTIRGPDTRIERQRISRQQIAATNLGWIDIQEPFASKCRLRLTGASVWRDGALVRNNGDRINPHVTDAVRTRYRRGCQ